MKKFYVTFGKFQYLISAVSDLQACMLAWRRYFQVQSKACPTVFIVSERGYRTCDTFVLTEGDSVIDAGLITQLCHDAAQDPEYFDDPPF